MALTLQEFRSFTKSRHYPLWLAHNHHKTHTNKNITFKGHLYLKEVLMDNSRFRVIKKSTQGGVSECLIIIAWAKASKGRTVFYVLPTDGLKQRFVTNRFEKSMAYTGHYQTVKAQSKIEKLGLELSLIDNQSLKDVGSGVINFAGSMSDIPFIEIPADDFIVDELDKCDYGRIAMGRERLGHSSDPQEMYVGNPSFVGSLLDVKYNESTKSRWTIEAPCGHRIKLNFFDHIVKQVGEFDYILRDPDYEPGSGRDIRPFCDKCNKPFDRFLPGLFEPEQKSDVDGKHISRLFSGTTPLTTLVDNFEKSIGNDYKTQRFHNSDLGESYTAEGSKISAKLIQDNIADYYMPKTSDGFGVAGIDIGSVHHVRVNKILPSKKKQAVFIGTVNTLQEVYSVLARYNVKLAVMDALPELTLARNFSHSQPGFFRCFFGSDKQDSFNIKEKTITLSRTAVFDAVKETFILGNILLPKNVMQFEEYVDHITEPTRVLDEEKKEYRWVSVRADHYFLAEVYAQAAEKIIKFIK